MQRHAVIVAEIIGKHDSDLLAQAGFSMAVKPDRQVVGLNGHSGLAAWTTAPRRLAAVQRFSTKIRGRELERQLIEDGNSPCRPKTATELSLERSFP